ncbi:hypothetical protein [Helicobacter pylori]|uniref:hypothetical protein n=1 Tax=Helicobacter pylori TaxID=210 RepID=UPI001E2FF617|nr:hypothetical protein [Helicobacter pylori]
MAKDRVVFKATLSNPPNSPRRERFETSLIWVRWGAMVGLEAREQARSRFFSLTLSGRRNP